MNQIIKNARNLVHRNASDLLLVGGVGCILGGGLLAIRRTPKAIKLLDEKDYTTVEKVKKVAPLFVLPVGLTVVGITQIVCARNITKNKIAAITTAYTVTETAYKTYRDKVRDIVEPEQYDNIQREVVRETVNKNPSKNKETFIPSSNKVWIYDNSADRYFEGTLNEIEKAVNTLNKRMRSEMTVSLNDFYSEIGINPTKTGNYLGWHIDKDEIDIYTSSGITDDGRPYIVLELLGFTSI